MAAFVIAYDLHQRNPDYDHLIAAIEEAFPQNCHVQLSVWIVVADATAMEVRDKLSSHVPRSASFLVSKLHNDSCWQGYPMKVCNWLSANL